MKQGFISQVDIDSTGEKKSLPFMESESFIIDSHIITPHTLSLNVILIISW
jgi:hypothetical protein